jgi:hypothetical protein
MVDTAEPIRKKDLDGVILFIISSPIGAEERQDLPKEGEKNAIYP